MEQTPSAEMYCGVIELVTVMSLCKICWVTSHGGSVSDRLLWNCFHASAALGSAQVEMWSLKGDMTKLLRIKSSVWIFALMSRP